ncbi:MAG: hypothetical protein AABZ44_08360 [Elusimicrobiota bacterium]
MPAKSSRLYSIALGLSAVELLAVCWLWLGSPPEWFRVNFYSISWWPFLVMVETWAKIIHGKSLLYDDPKGFLLLCAFSVPFWTAYEILNTVIKNWIYIGLPGGDRAALRWLGYVIAYASVLPAIRVYVDILGIRYPKELPVPDSVHRPFFSTTAIIIGMLLLALCVRHPMTFYPLAWAFSFFFTEPLLIREQSQKSYLLQWSAGIWLPTAKTLLAGFMAGVTWEFLNWHAQAKWVYTVPSDVILVKIFEMPVLGFIGFSAFALCAESFSNLLLTDLKAKKRELWKAGVALGALISVIGFAMIDTYTWIR